MKKKGGYYQTTIYKKTIAINHKNGLGDKIVHYSKRE